MKFVFLILHYKILNETITCINSILNNYKTNNIEIVIVDNGSQNGTGEIIREKYKENNNIHVLINKENLGFANGNNIGFKYAKDYLNPDFIIMANNDIVFSQKNFCEKIGTAYNEYNYSVLGPKVIMPNNKDANFTSELNTIRKQKLFIISQILRLILAYIFFSYIFDFARIIYRKFFPKKNNIKSSEIKENVILYGCCLIFSKNYIDLFDGIDNRTFLYSEEQLLYIRIIKNKLSTLYYPEIQVLHNEGVSTDKTITSKREKEIFISKNQIKSGIILLNELKEFYKNEE